MQTIRILALSIAGLLAGLVLMGQEETNPYKGLPFKDRIFLGGDLGLSIGNDITFIRVAPMLGYNVSDKLAIGAGPSYQYWEDRRFVPKLESTIIGGAAFARYFIFEQLFLQSQFEVLNLEEINFSPVSDFGERDRVTIPVLFLGAGYTQRIAGGSGLFIAVMYDVIGDLNSPYPNNLVVRVGGFIGL